MRMLTFAVAVAGITVLAPGAGESSGDAVNFERRPRPHAFEHGIAGLAGQLRRADFVLQKFGFAERQTLPNCAFRRAAGGSTSS